ncbi:hypothetical protein GYMLUDRAFT_327597 [Collybiopsis luxurians FD-317 M1]|nr:hypothetical protein GYMLUDRAFT_327597 [Collybiopsis luxurians FD-317 M1]
MMSFKLKQFFFLGLGNLLSGLLCFPSIIHCPIQLSRLRTSGMVNLGLVFSFVYKYVLSRQFRLSRILTSKHSRHSASTRLQVIREVNRELNYIVSSREF